MALYRDVSYTPDCHLKMLVDRHLRLDQNTKTLQANYRENIRL